MTPTPSERRKTIHVVAVAVRQNHLRHRLRRRFLISAIIPLIWRRPRRDDAGPADDDAGIAAGAALSSTSGERRMLSGLPVQPNIKKTNAEDRHCCRSVTMLNSPVSLLSTGSRHDSIHAAQDDR
jgi:hypothetical protein